MDGNLGQDISVLSNSSLMGVVNDGNNLGQAVTKDITKGGKGNFATKPITEPLRFATNAGAVTFVKLSDTVKSIPNVSQFQAISQSR